MIFITSGGYFQKYLRIGVGGISGISRIAGGGRLKFITIAAGVVIAVVLGPAIIENNEYLRNNYGGFVSWKEGLFGLGAAAPVEEYVEEVQDPVEETTGPGNRVSVVQNEPVIAEVAEEPTPIVVSVEKTEIVAPPSEFTDDNFDILSSSPDKFAGYNVSISGQVYNIIDQSTPDWQVLSLRMHVKAEAMDGSRAVVILQTPKEDPASKGIALEDCVVIAGTVRGGITEIDRLGMNFKAPLIDSFTVSEIECVDSAMPAYRTDEIEITQTLNGVRLTAQRVQFAEDHVRVKITAENIAGGGSVFIREKESFAQQGGNIYPSTSHIPIYTHYRLDSRIVPEFPSTNYLFFEPADGGKGIIFRIMVEEIMISTTIRSDFIFTIK